MNVPALVLRVLFAWLGYSSVHWAAGRWRRALFWDAAMIAAILLVWHAPLAIFWVVGLGQIVDAAIIKPARARSTGGYAIAALIAFCASLLVSTVMRHTWMEAFKIPSGGVIPTLQVGDQIFVDKTARTPARGDVTVFIYPKEPDKDFVKRVIAVGGDTIEIRDNQLVLNGQPVPRQHVDGPCEYDDFVDDTSRWEKRRCDAWDETLGAHHYRVYQEADGQPHSFPARTVPAGHVFVMGDNRDNSYDSRFWGTVPPENIKGVARKIWWSSGPNGIRWERLGHKLP
jgi:signal peptidase I